MLKRIKPEQVRLGMFIEAIDGTWKGQRFWRSRFLLNNPNEVQTLKASGVDGIIINTDEGNDAVVATSGKSRCARTAALKSQTTRAQRTIEQTKPLIKTMFEDAGMGGSVPVGTATLVVEQIATCMTDSSRP